MAAVDDFLTCAVCLEWYKSPRRLPCFHVYCLECLRGLVKPGTSYLTCPECRCEHAIASKGVEEFRVDGRLEQFMEKQKTLEPDSCLDCKQNSTLSECDHCQLLTCQQCQTKHRAQLLESLLQDLQQFHTEFCTVNEIATRQKLKTELVRHKENLGTLKTRIVEQFDALLKEVENRQQTLLLIFDEEEKLILHKLSQLERADLIASQSSSFVSGIQTNSMTKAVVSLKEELMKVKLITSPHGGFGSKGLLSIRFQDEQKLKEMISSYGVVFTAVDYKKPFKILTTLDGSECREVGLLSKPWGLTVCPFTDDVYVTDDASIRVYNSDGKYIRHIVTNDLPRGLAVDSNKQVIVASLRENNVKIYNHDLKLMGVLGSEGDQVGEFRSPFGVACDSYNNIYVAERDNDRIQVFTPDGTFLSLIGLGVLNGPRCVQINLRQEVLVTNSDHGQVDMFSKDGKHLRSIIGEGNDKLKVPRGIVLDNNGYILVSDNASKTIQVYKDDSTHYCRISKPADAMNHICCLAVTKSGVVFVTNFEGNKIHLIATT